MQATGLRKMASERREKMKGDSRQSKALDDAAARIEALEVLLLKCQHRLFGRGPSTDPFYSEIVGALGQHQTGETK